MTKLRSMGQNCETRSKIGGSPILQVKISHDVSIFLTGDGDFKCHKHIWYKNEHRTMWTEFCLWNDMN